MRLADGAIESGVLTQTVDQRIAIIEEALNVQSATGASHLQKVEMHPAAYGQSESVRPYVKYLRQRRNVALHGFVDLGQTRDVKENSREDGQLSREHLEE